MASKRKPTFAEIFAVLTCLGFAFLFIIYRAAIYHPVEPKPNPLTATSTPAERWHAMNPAEQVIYMRHIVNMKADTLTPDLYDTVASQAIRFMPGALDGATSLQEAAETAVGFPLGYIEGAGRRAAEAFEMRRRGLDSAISTGL